MLKLSDDYSSLTFSDLLSVNRATSFAERLRLNLAVIHGEVKPDDNEDDRSSPPPQEVEDDEGLSMPPIVRTPSKSGVNVDKC